MTDIIPDSSNRAAHLLGLLLHPFPVAIVTLLIVLSELRFAEAIVWTTLVGSVLIVPLGISLVYLRHRQRYTYQRHVRGPIYLSGWVCIGFCLLLLLVLDGPSVLLACMGALLVWVPLQALINAHFTKVSTHVAVITGCTIGVMMLDTANEPVVFVLCAVLIVITGWARVVTRNHTINQVLLGVVTGSLPVLITFPILLP
jgi:hypothetical protein